MDKKLLKELNLLEAHKQFMRLCEWSYVPSSLEEDDDDPQDGAEDMGGMPQDGQDPMGGDMGADAPQGDMGGAEDPNAMGGEMSTMDGMGDTPQDGQDPIGGNMGDPNAMGGEMPPMDGMDEEPQEEDDVIDVEDITNAQEKMNSKVNTVGKDLGELDDKITSLMQAIESMQQMIDSNNAQIQDFKKEFIKRTPTSDEKLNLRSLDSYPFNVNPKDYWEEKAKDPNSKYSATFNNGLPTTAEYKITNNDIDDFSEREIEQSFDIDDSLVQDIKKIFNL